MNGTAKRVYDALSHLNIKSDGNNAYRCNSPFRAGSDSMSFVVKFDDDEHGTYIDHVSGESGSLYQLAEKLGVATPLRPTIASTKRAYDGIKDYAILHGVTDDVLKAWGWSQSDKHGRMALAFPTQNGVRYRFLDGQKGKPVYISEKGYKSCWYGLYEHDTIKTRLIDGMPLVFCNGEISTVSGQYHGLASVCVTSGEKAKIPHELMKDLKATLFEWGVKPKIIVALDCDEAGRHSARGVVDQFKKEGFNAIAIDLGLGVGGDLADFCMLHESSSHAQLERCNPLPDEKNTPTRSHFQIVDLDGLFALPNVEWLIPRLLPKQGLMAVYGRSGTYKSFFALDMALSLATHSTVLYIAAEGQLGYKQRIKAWNAFNSETPSFFRALLGSVDLYDTAMLDELIEGIKGANPQLVVLDTLAMVSGIADENSTRDMNKIVNGLYRIKTECNTAVMAVHHTGKSGDDERGSSAFRGAMDVMIKLSKSQDSDVITVECTKMKDAPSFKTYYLKPKTIDLGYDDELGNRADSVILDPTKGEQIGTDNLTDTQRQTLRAIVALEKRHAPNTERTLTAIARATGMRKGTVSKHIQKFTEAGVNFTE